MHTALRSRNSIVMAKYIKIISNLPINILTDSVYNKAIR